MPYDIVSFCLMKLQSLIRNSKKLEFKIYRL